MTQEKLTKKQKRQKMIEEEHKEKSLQIKHIKPLTDTQKKVFDAYQQDQHLFLSGCAGTGKTFVATFLSLQEILGDLSEREKLYIVRSAVPTRQIGYLPGTLKEKIEEYEFPYISIFEELFDRKDAYQFLKQQKKVEFLSTSFLRGLTFNDCVVLVDEDSNLNFHELDTLITRTGKNCRLIFCGDVRQCDFDGKKEKSGVPEFIKIIKNIKQFSIIEFCVNDIVRSGLVKQYIKQKIWLEERGQLDVYS
jgi:phosphate starvation-inducible protein PhoH